MFFGHRFIGFLNILVSSFLLYIFLNIDYEFQIPNFIVKKIEENFNNSISTLNLSLNEIFINTRRNYILSNNFKIVSKNSKKPILIGKQAKFVYESLINIQDIRNLKLVTVNKIHLDIDFVKYLLNESFTKSKIYNSQSNSFNKLVSNYQNSFKIEIKNLTFNAKIVEIFFEKLKFYLIEKNSLILYGWGNFCGNNDYFILFAKLNICSDQLHINFFYKTQNISKIDIIKKYFADNYKLNIHSGSVGIKFKYVGNLNEVFSNNNITENEIWNLIRKNGIIIIENQGLDFTWYDIYNKVNSKIVINKSKVFSDLVVKQSFINFKEKLNTYKITSNLKLGEKFKSIDKLYLMFSSKISYLDSYFITIIMPKSINMKLKIDKYSLENANLSGKISLRNQKGSYNSLRANFNLFAENVNYEKWHTKNLLLSAQYKHNDILATFSAKALDGNVSGYLVGKFLKNENFTSNVSLNIDGISISNLRISNFDFGKANIKLAGKINLSSNNIEYRFSGTSEISNFKSNFIFCDSLEFNFSFNNNTWKIYNIIAKFTSNYNYVDNDKFNKYRMDSFIKLAGEIINGNFNSTISCKSVDVCKIQNFIKDVKGELSLEGYISGHYSNPKISGNLIITNFKYPNFSLKNLLCKAYFEFENSTLSLNPALLYDENVQLVEAILKVNVKNQNLKSLYLTFSKIDNTFISDDFIRKFCPYKLGKFILNGNIIYIKQTSEVNIYLEKSLVAIENFELKNLCLEGKYNILHSIFTINSLKALLEEGEIIVNGRFANFANFDFFIKGINLRTKRVLFANMVLQLENINFEGFFQRKLGKNIGEVTFICKKFSLNNFNLGGFGGALKVNDSFWEINNVFDILSLLVTAKVDVNYGTYNVNIQTSEFNLNKIKEIQNISFLKFDDFVLSAIASIKGNYKIDLFPLSINVLVAKFLMRKKQTYLELERKCKIIYENSQIIIDNIMFRLGNAHLKFIFKRDSNSKFHIDTELKKLRISDIRNFLPNLNLNLDSEISYKGIIKFSSCNPELEGTISFDKVNYRQRRLPELEAKILLNKEHLNIVRGLFKFNDFLGEISANIPLKSFYSSGSDKQFYIRLFCPNSNISNLKELFPDKINYIEGRLEGDLEVKGCLYKPQVYGKIKVNLPKLSVKSIKQTFYNINFEVDTQDKILIIKNISCRIGNGSIRGYGNIDFTDTSNGKIDINLYGNNVDLDYIWLSGKGIDLRLGITRSLYEPFIRADVKFKKAIVNLDNIRNKEQNNKHTNFLFNAIQKIDYLIKIEALKNFWIKNSFINSELKGSIKVEGNNNDYQIIGEAQVIRGWINFQRKKFNIESGEFKFGELIESSERKKIEPYVKIKSSANISNIQVYLYIDGSLSSFTPKLYSSPPLSEGDILSLILVGRNLKDALQADVRSLFEKEILEGLRNTYLSGMLGSRISRVLNLDELYLGSLFDKENGITQSFLRLGKYINNNVFFAYEGTLNNEGKKTYILEFRLPRSFLFTFEIEKPVNKSKFGIVYDWKF